MPTQEWINEIKKKQPKLFKTEIGKDIFVFRPLGRKEHLEIQKEAFPDGMPMDPMQITGDQNAEMENKAIKLCVLWPENIDPDKMDAGTVPTLATQIMASSGFSVPTEPIEL